MQCIISYSDYRRLRKRPWQSPECTRTSRERFRISTGIFAVRRRFKIDLNPPLKSRRVYDRRENHAVGPGRRNTPRDHRIQRRRDKIILYEGFGFGSGLRENCRKKFAGFGRAFPFYIERKLNVSSYSRQSLRRTQCNKLIAPDFSRPWRPPFPLPVDRIVRPAVIFPPVVRT